MRLYLNCFEEYPYLWSIDEGTLETERKYKKVTMADVALCTAYDLTAPEGHPKCWLEIDKTMTSLVEQRDGAVTIYGTFRGIA